METTKQMLERAYTTKEKIIKANKKRLFKKIMYIVIQLICLGFIISYCLQKEISNKDIIGCIVWTMFYIECNIDKNKL